MAHFAEIDENNLVTQVIVVHNNDCLDENGVESELVGQLFCYNLFGGYWRQTSYNANFRKNYAGVGYTFDKNRNAFIPPKPFESWLLDEESCQWVAPTPMPQDNKLYRWDEAVVSWVEVQQT